MTAATSSWRSSATTERLAVARVIGVKGLRGALKLELLTDWPERLVAGAELFVEGQPDARRIVSTEWGGRVPVLTLAGIDSREAAEELAGRFLERVAERLPEGELYWHELEGIAVEDPSGRRVGVVVGVFRAGETEVYEIETAEGGELLVPALRHVVRELDVTAQRMVIDYREEEPS